MVVKENKYSILFYSILKLCEGHLAMSGQQEPVLLLSMSNPQRPRGLSCTWTCLQYSWLCCTEMCLHHKGLNYTCTCLDNRSLCCSWVSTPPGKELHLAMSGKQEPVLLLSMSKPQGPELHLDLSTLQLPMLHLNVFTPQGPELYLYLPGQ